MIISSPPELDDVDESQDETSLDFVVTAKASEVRELIVSPEFHGQRLDRMLVAGVPEFSRSYLQQLLEDGAVSRGGVAQLKSAFKVKAGEPLLSVATSPVTQSLALRRQLAAHLARLQQALAQLA